MMIGWILDRSARPIVGPGLPAPARTSRHRFRP